MKRFKVSLFVVLAVIFGTVSAFTTKTSPKSLVVYANTLAKNPMPTPPPSGSNGLQDVTTDYNNGPSAWRLAHCASSPTTTCVATWNTSTNSYSNIFQGIFQP